jgi:hypothetical protein
MIRSGRRALICLLLLTSTGACQTRAPDPGRVQEALRTGAAGALATSVVAATPATPDADALPHVTLLNGAARFDADDAHQQISATRRGDRLAVTWTDRAHDGVWFGVTDLRGASQGSTQRVYATVTDEERADAPSAVTTGEGFAVAWVDGENGRVMFRRLDAQRRPAGAAVIVHEGLESPRAVTLVATREGFGLAAALWQGVYFTQLDARGARVDDGAMVSEGDAVTALHDLRWERDAYTVAFSTSQNGQPARVERRIAVNPRARGPVG